MYNAEKYIADTLESILAQTFQNFEVIVVNDCSTDNSRQIVESYLEKFDGRLKLFDNEKNSGVSTTRNNGLRKAIGEYVFFMDADDLFVPNSLEGMYTLAKKFNVDFFNFTKGAVASEDGKEFTVGQTKLIPEDVVMIEENLNWRVESLLKCRFNWGIYRKFLRRDFLIENNLSFPDNVKFAEDQTWTYGIFFCAKRIVHSPDVCYYYRKSAGSLCRSRMNFFKSVIRWLYPLTGGMKWLDNIMSKIEFFQQNPSFQYMILESFTSRYFNKIFKDFLTVKQQHIYEAIRKNLCENLGEDDVLIAQLCTFVNAQQKQIDTLKKNIDTQRKKIVGLEKQLKSK